MRTALIGLLLVAATLLAMLASCGGRGENIAVPPIDDGGVTPTPQVADPITHLTSYLQAQAARLDAYASTAKGSLKGTLTIKSYTILDSRTMQPLPAATAIGKVPLRVVDPEDDVDSIPYPTYPSLNGTFLLRDIPAKKYTILRVEFYVAEDVNGDRLGNDRILCSIPIAIAAGRQSTIQLTLEPLSTAIPVGGYVGMPVQLSYHYKGPDGTRTRKLVIISGGRTYMDTNNDGSFGAVDIQFTDRDGDGRSDAGEVAPTSGAALGGYTTGQAVAGLVTSLYGDRLVITDLRSGLVELTISESTIVVDEFGMQVSLTEHNIGKQAAAMVIPVSGGLPVTTVLMLFLNPQPSLSTAQLVH